MQKNFTKRGSITIEAAIILPIFFLALIAMAFVIRIISLEEQISFVATDEAKYVATQAYQQEGLAQELLIEGSLRYRINNRLDEEVKLDGGYVSEFSYRYKDQGLTDLISYSVDYPIKFPIPFYQNQNRWGYQSLIFRAFVGRSQEETFVVSEELEEEDIIVWVFPVAGERYHMENCPHIKVLPRQTSLTPEIKRSYRPCKHCHPEELSTGNMVYIFPSSGQVYHRGNCFLVDRYVVSMEKSIAEQKGYTPCLTCIGGK